MKIPQYRISAVVRVSIQAAKPGRRICYDGMNISLNGKEINRAVRNGSLFALKNQIY
ncbi:hypothetical protein TUM1886_54400 (plasmid) [Escherichia coli]|jgi:hypothetical protein|nr:hypothetical protein TUM1886_54400 [Escherichia coli]